MTSPIPFYQNIYKGETFTAGQGVISIRFDCDITADFTALHDLLDARNLFVGWSYIRTRINNAGHLTLAQLLAYQAEGHEIMCHSRTHTHPATWAAFKDETVKAASEMWLIGLKAVTWVQPGWGQGTYWIDDPEGTDSVANNFLMSYFNSYTAYGPGDIGVLYNMPFTHANAITHSTGDTESLATIEGVVNNCIANGRGVEYLFHPSNIDAVDNISLDDFTAFLDYLVTKIGTGDIKVMTPTQQIFATAT